MAKRDEKQELQKQKIKTAALLYFSNNSSTILTDKPVSGINKCWIGLEKKKP